MSPRLPLGSSAQHLRLHLLNRKLVQKAARTGSRSALKRRHLKEQLNALCHKAGLCTNHTDSDKHGRSGGPGF